MKRKWTIEIIAALLILLFTYTALSKFLEFDSFKSVLKRSPLIGDKAGPVALGLPVIELLVSVLLLIPRVRLSGFFASAILMTVFTLYLSYMIIFRSDLPCSCGGVLKQLNWNQHLLLNVFFMLISLVGIWLSRKKPHRDVELEQSTSVIFT